LKISEAQTHSYKLFTDHNTRLGRTWTPLTMATKLLEEAGEAVSVILGLEGLKPKGEYTRDMLGRELSDLLYNILIIAETHNIDLEKACRQVIDKYEDHLFGDQNEQQTPPPKAPNPNPPTKRQKQLKTPGRPPQKPLIAGNQL